MIVVPWVVLGGDEVDDDEEMSWCVQEVWVIGGRDGRCCHTGVGPGVGWYRYLSRLDASANTASVLV